MKLKNSALQELYDTVVNSTITISPYEASPIDKAFKECDNKLSESITFAVLKDLQDSNDILKRSNKALLEANMESISKTRKLEKDLDYAKNLLDYGRHSRDTWRDRAKHAEKEVEDLKKELQDAKTTLVKVDADRTNLQEACDKLSEENGSLNTRIDCLRLEVNWYRKLCGDEYLNKLLDSTRDTGYKQDQKDLWNMLQEVSDYYYFGGDDEFDTDDCEMTSMTDIIDNLNVDQFLEAYKNWHKAQEQHRWEYKPIARRLSQPLECTLEGTIKINGDLLNKVCGIDSDD